MFGHVLIHSLECTFFQLCFNAEQISVRLARFRRSYVNRPAVILTSHTNYAVATFLFLQLFVPDDSVFA